MESLAYLIKQRWPGLFRLIERLARRFSSLRFGRRIKAAQQAATVTGSVDGRAAEIQSIGVDDLATLHEFLFNLPDDWLKYFHPHPFDRKGLQTVLRSRAFLNYGLFVEGNLIGYALLKVAPTGSAFIGLLVHPDFSRLGIGKFIVAYLYWQGSLAELRVRSTISKTNPASLKSHQAVADYQIVAELPNDYIMIEFPAEPRERPELQLP